MVAVGVAVFGVLALATVIGVGATRRGESEGALRTQLTLADVTPLEVDAGTQPILPALTLDVGSDADPPAVVEPALVDAGPAPEKPAVVVVEDKGKAKLARKGKLSLETEPWTKVYLGKRLLGETPLLEVPLPAGLQRLRVQNLEEGIDAVIEVDIIADAVVIKRLAL